MWHKVLLLASSCALALAGCGLSRKEKRVWGWFYVYATVRCGDRLLADAFLDVVGHGLELWLLRASSGFNFALIAANGSKYADQMQCTNDGSRSGVSYGFWVLLIKP